MTHGASNFEDVFDPRDQLSDERFEDAKKMSRRSVGGMDPMADNTLNFLESRYKPRNRERSDFGLPQEGAAPFDALTESLKLARANVRKRMQAGEGRNDTIKTLGLGDISGSNLERKTLLGF